jgi:hypothetical protein
MAFYEAAFATVIACTPAARRAGALLTVTVVAGLAGSIFLPLTGFLVQAYGWRTSPGPPRREGPSRSALDTA